MIKCCIFDLDGTLFNTLPTITHYVNLTLESYGLQHISERECCDMIGHGAKYLIDSALDYRGAHTLDYSVVLAEYNALYNSDTLYLTEPYPHISEMLTALSDSGVLLGVLSNKPEDTTRNIISAFFPGTFASVHGGRAGVALKPSPDPLFSMMAELGVSADEVAYLGDTGVDMSTGKAAGVALTVGVSWGFRERGELIDAGADVIADTPSDIVREVLSRD